MRYDNRYISNVSVSCSNFYNQLFWLLLWREMCGDVGRGRWQVRILKVEEKEYQGSHEEENHGGL